MRVTASIIALGLILILLGLPARGANDSPAAAPTEARLQAAEFSGGVTVDTGPMSFQLADRGALRSLCIGEKVLVATGVFESSQYDGYRDAVPGTILPAAWRADRHEYRQGGKEF